MAPPKEVVIVGASFGGLQVASELAGRGDLRVTVVDAQDYWEFTPSMHTALAGPRSAEALLVKLDEALLKDVTFVQGRATGVVGNRLQVGAETLPFDYLVVATGCSYSSPIRPEDDDVKVGGETDLAARRRAVEACKEKVAAAKSVLIVGGGAVGVEMAAEIAAATASAVGGGGETKKKVCLATNAAELVLDLPETVRQKAAQWLRDAGVDVKFNCKVASHAEEEEGVYELTSGSSSGVVVERLEADLCFWCIGGKPRSAFLKGIAPLDDRGFVVVDPATLKSPANVNGVYAVGDVAAKPDAQRLASYAHFEGEYVAKAIVADVDDDDESSSDAPYVPPPRMVALSLGPRDGAFVYDSVHVSLFPGFLVPVLKAVIELWFIRLLPMPYTLLKLLPGDHAARLWSKPPRRQQRKPPVVVAGAT